MNTNFAYFCAVYLFFSFIFSIQVTTSFGPLTPSYQIMESRWGDCSTSAFTLIKLSNKERKVQFPIHFLRLPY